MKLREGFVSNSSSSSYVLIGCRLSDEEISQKLGIDEDDVYEKLEELGLFHDGEDNIVGHLIADGDDTDFGGKEISIGELMEKANDVVTKLSVPIEEITIISGIRSC